MRADFRLNLPPIGSHPLRSYALFKPHYLTVPPVTEELLNALPVLVFAVFFSDDRKDILPAAIKEALDKKELSINKGYDLTRQLQDLPEEQREQAAAEALEYEKAKKELKKQDAEIDRKGKIAALFCKAYEKAVLLTPSEENIRCWTDGTRMTPEEMRDTVKESRELAEVFRTIADIIEQKILPADWRCVDAGNEENGAQPDRNPA